MLLRVPRLTHTYLHTYLQNYLLTHLHTYAHTYLHTYLHTCFTGLALLRVAKRRPHAVDGLCTSRDRVQAAGRQHARGQRGGPVHSAHTLGSRRLRGRPGRGEVLGGTGNGGVHCGPGSRSRSDAARLGPHLQHRRGCACIGVHLRGTWHISCATILSPKLSLAPRNVPVLCLQPCAPTRAPCRRSSSTTTSSISSVWASLRRQNVNLTSCSKRARRRTRYFTRRLKELLLEMKRLRGSQKLQWSVCLPLMPLKIGRSHNTQYN